MNDKDRREINLFILIMCTVLLAIGMLWNYVIYKANQQDYVICSVNIIKQESLSKATGWAVFECDIDGVVVQGRVVLNFWERKGDRIEVAYHKYNHSFVRPNLCLDGFSAAMLFWCVALTGYFIIGKVT